MDRLPLARHHLLLHLQERLLRLERHHLDRARQLPAQHRPGDGVGYCDVLHYSYVYNFLAFAVSLVFLFYLAWYYSYRSMCHENCCFFLSRSFWSPIPTVKVE